MDLSYVKEKRILLVDDEETILYMIQGILGAEGYTQIKTAGNVHQALELCREWKPELAVLDVIFLTGTGLVCFRK